MLSKKILFGICGIGRGHIYRQLPIILHFLPKSEIVIFGFSESYKFYSEYFANHSNVKVIEVSVPWIHGNKNGINYIKTADDPFNKTHNFISQNFNAFTLAEAFFKSKPDLIISDYEPTAAQFAYASNTPLVTIDQQSKYFFNGYPEIIDGLSFLEERARLNMFFPKATQRIACSFFQPPTNKITYSKIDITVVAPPIRNEIIKLKSQHFQAINNILVYLSTGTDNIQDSHQIISIFSNYSKYNFQIYAPNGSDFLKFNGSLPKNIMIRPHGDPSYIEILGSSIGAICTSGHTFLSEMVFLNKPVYTIPLDTYEQKYNAQIINMNNFGISHHKIDTLILNQFLLHIPYFTENIKNDNSILLNKASGEDEIVAHINNLLNLQPART